MSAFLVIPVIITAAAALLILGRWVTQRSGPGLVDNPAIDQQILFQPLAAPLAVISVVAASLVSGQGPGFLRVGDLHAPVFGLGWFAVEPADTTWLGLGYTLGATITLVTTGIVWLQASKSGAVEVGRIPAALLWSVPIAASNAAIEEAIFRLALADALANVASAVIVALLSGLLFGLPHYFGNPGRVPGVLLAGFLGWLLCLSVLETGGMGWAWGVHFAQDVVIFTILFAVSATTLARNRDAAPR